MNLTDAKNSNRPPEITSDFRQPVNAGVRTRFALSCSRKKNVEALGLQVGEVRVAGKDVFAIVLLEGFIVAFRLTGNQPFSEQRNLGLRSKKTVASRSTHSGL
ncbi:MAG: hypothetical protein ACRD82_10770 [Blastocatellia bacterium]